VLIAFVIKLHLYNFVIYPLDNPPKNDSMRRFSWLGADFVMCGFAFASGAFGHSHVSGMSFATTVCRTLGTSFLFSMCLGIIRNGFPHATFALYFETWYLQALLLFRAIFIPLLHLSGARRAVACALWSVATSLVLLALIPLELPLDAVNIKGTLFILPFYAIGFLLTSDQWLEYAHEPRLSCACLVFGILWYVCIALSSQFRGWADVACWASGQCENFTCPVSLTHTHGISVESVGILLRIYLQKLSIALAMLVVFINGASCLHYHAPKCAGFLADSGSRTLYAYLLHFMFFVCLGSETGFYGQVRQRLPWWGFNVFMAFIWLLACFVCTCKLTGYMFHWMFRPDWLLLPISALPELKSVQQH